ncbi:hypothetical protein Cpap_4082 [Ruminiclostridium papyrosolvens DSM 2782]|uniref:Uncharacterized protein n=1 Tax=Ruminiclostridium papyrosolvens DSM 2782 TaxID=588581 RepID=F1T842_9FIRM|nr:hypothetical protein [Ruminiclostridium papyrosolvens]EGD49640.1 hypothetical protein Cpap_4082 [Ruminiclostridium papyrosolvens DSM 2782]WES33228.1 hypothetical protein P0092_15870 [Ruminiclostridium papyrosolvens DSM 2782]
MKKRLLILISVIFISIIGTGLFGYSFLTSDLISTTHAMLFTRKQMHSPQSQSSKAQY